MKKDSLFRKIIYIAVCLSLVFQQSGLAQVTGQLDLAGRLKGMDNTLPQAVFRPMHLRYLSYDSINNNFKLLLDKGNINREAVPDSEFEQETKTLLEYFFIGIALPNDKFWVNLRPDSPDNMIDSYLARTDLGKVLLEADLQLKKDTARMTSPETPEGREYWSKLYKKAGELFGQDNITIPTLTRPWIVPDEIIIRDANDNAYIYKATLKVMLEQDYLKDSTEYSFKDARLKQLNEYSSELIRENIIPILTREVNTGKNYASLRQVYHSLILAQWFKQKFNGKDGKYSRLINGKDLQGLTSENAWNKDTYFKEYQKSFQQGEYNLKEQVSTIQGQVIRNYMSGGADFKGVTRLIETNKLSAASPVREAMVGSNLRGASYHNGGVKIDDAPFRQTVKPQGATPSIKKSIFAWFAAIVAAVIQLSSCTIPNTEPVNPPGVIDEVPILENNNVHIADDVSIIDIKSDNSIITVTRTIETWGGNKAVFYHSLNLKDKTITSNAYGKIVPDSMPSPMRTATLAGDSEIYDLYLEPLLVDLRSAISMQEAKHTLKTGEADYLNKVYSIANDHQWFVPTFVDIPDVRSRFRIKYEDGKITIKYVSLYGKLSDQLGDILDPQNNSISYIPYPYAGDNKDKMITVTSNDGTLEYFNRLTKMFNTINYLSGKKENLTVAELDIFNKAHAILNEEMLEIRNFEFSVWNGFVRYDFKHLANGEITVNGGGQYGMPGTQSGFTSHLDGSISYVPYYLSPDTWNREGKTITLTYNDNPEEWSRDMGLMISYNESALDMKDPIVPLVGEDRTTLETMLDVLKKRVSLYQDSNYKNINYSQFTVRDNFVAFTFKAENNRITVDGGGQYGMPGTKGGFTLNPDGSISFIPYYLSYNVANSENKTVISTYDKDGDEYIRRLGYMLSYTESALDMKDPVTPLTDGERKNLELSRDILKKRLSLPQDSKLTDGERKIIESSIDILKKRVSLSQDSNKTPGELNTPYAYYRKDGTIIRIPIPAGLASSADNQASSSPATKGGIDFRTLPINKILLANPGIDLKLNFQAPIPIAELENERIKIENMLKAGLIPSSERVADYLVSCYKKDKGFEQDADKTLSFIADILRIEEERALPTEPAFKLMLSILEQVSG